MPGILLLLYQIVIICIKQVPDKTIGGHMIQHPLTYWDIPQRDLVGQLKAKEEGLNSAEAKQRLIQYGPNLLTPPKRSDTFALLIAQFKSPIILTLSIAAGLSAVLQDPVDAVIIIAIVFILSKDKLSGITSRGA